MVNKIVEQFLSSFDHDNSDFKNRIKETLLAKGFPNVKNPNWKYTNITKILNSKYKPNKSIEDISYNYEKIDINTLINTNSNILNLMGDISKMESFELLNLLLAKNINILRVTKGSKEEIKIDNTFVGNSENISLSTNIIIVEDSAIVDILDISRSSSDCLALPLTYIYCSKDSRISYNKVSKVSKDSKLIDSTNINVKGYVNSFYYSRGANLLRNNLKLQIFKNGEASINGLYSLHGGHLDNNTRIEHLERDTRSNQVYKGVVDSGTGTFSGSIYVAKHAVQSSSHQLNKTLLLSDGSVMNTKPELEIFAGDIECSHGATVGSMNKEELFYIESRGISKDEAKKMLVDSFLNSMVKDLKDNVKKEIEL